MALCLGLPAGLAGKKLQETLYFLLRTRRRFLLSV